LSIKEQLVVVNDPRNLLKTLRKFFENADANMKVGFLALPSLEDQLDYVHDPGKHQKILGRKP
jgi:hypothetical protein